MNGILRKTEAAQAALQIREGEGKLSARTRTLLLQVDGLRRFEEVRDLAISLGNPGEAVEQLMQKGLIEIIAGTEIPETVAEEEVSEPTHDPEYAVSPKLPEHLHAVAKEMIQLIDSYVGFKGLLLKRKISHCNNESELRQALLALHDALVRATNEDQTEELLVNVYRSLPMMVGMVQMFRPV